MALSLLDPDVQEQLKMMNQPSEEDRAAARSQALLSLGLGMMANSTGPRGSTGLGQIVGRAGLGSMDDYQRSLMMAQQKRQQEFQMGMGLMKMKREADQQERLNNLSDTLSKALAPQTHEQITGYRLNNEPDQNNIRFDPAAQGDIAKVAQQLIQKQAAGGQLTPDQQMIVDQVRSRIEPIKQQVQVQPNHENVLRTLGVQYGVQSPELGNMLLKAADQYKPQAISAGSYMRDPATGRMAFVGDPNKGVTVGPNGEIQAMQGSNILAQLAAQQEGAKEAAVQRARAPYADPIKLEGAGAGGGTAYIPRVNAPELNGQINGVSPVVQKGQEAFNTNWITNTYQPVQDAGKSADSILGQVQTLRQIPINTGWGTDAKAAGAAVLEGLGIAPGNAAMYASNAQKFQQVSSERLWTVLNAAKGPQTEGDATRAKQTFAALKNTPEANAFILDLAEANARREKIKASYYQDAYQLAAKDGNYAKVDQEWRKIQRSIWDDPIMQKWSKK